MAYRILVSFLFAFLWVMPCKAEVFVAASVDRNEMRPGDTFTLTLQVESDGSVEVGNPDWPAFPGFQPVNSWSGNEIQSVFENGRFVTKRRQTFHLQLQALREGEYTIDPIRVNVDGNSLSTKPIRVKVSAAAAPPSSAAEEEEEGVDPFGGGIDDVFNQILQDRLRRLRGARPGAPTEERNDPNVNVEEPVFVMSTVDKNTVFEGEQITVSYYLYSRVQISDIDTLQYPTLAGFWKEDIEVATRLNFRPEIVNGVQFSKALLASYALFPIKAGPAKVDEYKAKLTLVNFNPFGSARSRAVVKSSKPVKITVLPLPKEARPANFSGGVGDFTLQTTIDNRNPKVNQPVTLKLRFEGRGNPKLIELPQLPLPNGLELYDTQSEAKFLPNGTGFKEFRLLLIPRQAGNFTVEPVAIGLFNPAKKMYYSVTTSTVQIDAAGEASPQDQPALNALATTSSREPLKPQLPPLILKFEDEKRWGRTMKATLWGGLYALSFLILLVLGRMELGEKEKREKLRHLVQKRFARVDEQYSKGQWRQAASDVTNAIYFTLGELSGIGGGSEELEKMILKAPPSFRNQNKEKLERLMKIFESLAFAPEAMVADLKEKQKFDQSVNEVKQLLLAATHLEFADD